MFLTQVIFITLGQLVCGRNSEGKILVRCPNTYSEDTTNYAGVDFCIIKCIIDICYEVLMTE